MTRALPLASHASGSSTGSENKCRISQAARLGLSIARAEDNLEETILNLSPRDSEKREADGIYRTFAGHQAHLA